MSAKLPVQIANRVEGFVFALTYPSGEAEGVEAFATNIEAAKRLAFQMATELYDAGWTMSYAGPGARDTRMIEFQLERYGLNSFGR